MKTLLMMSLTGSLMALVVMALRALFGKRLHPRVTYALWLAAALCLLLPLRFESKMSVMNAPAARNLERSVSVRMEQPVAYGFVTGNTAQNGQNDIHYMDAPAREELESGLVQPEQSFTVDAWDIAGLIWAAGALATAGYIAIVNARFRGRVRRSRRAAAVPWVMERRLGGTKVYVSRAVPSPCLVGLFRPYIVVTPQAMAEDERFCHVLVHELSHKRQGDPLWSAVRTAVLVVHWFNPIVWVAASLSRADCENACDALTIRELGEDRRVDYGKTLLSFLRAKPTATGLVNTATTMAQSRRQIRRRISLIAKKQKYTLVAAVLCVVLALTGCAVTMTTAPGEQPAQEPVAAVPTEVPEGQDMSDGQRAAFEQAKHAALLQGGDWQYAETDIDSDGSVELLLLSDLGYIAGQTLQVLGYDEATNALHEQLNEYPLATFYGNGMVEVGWSHSQGLAGDALWPYTLYRYDAAGDVYQRVAMVDAWDKGLYAEGFPEDVDKEGAGAVYYIMPGDEEDYSSPVSQSEYDAWRNEMVGGAANIQVDYLPLTEDSAQLADDKRPGGQLRVFMDTYEAAIEFFASGFENMTEAEARAALPGLEDFVLYGRKNDAGDAYILAVLPEAPAAQPVTRRYLSIGQMTAREEAAVVIEQYGVTDAGEEVLLRGYTVQGDIFLNSVDMGSAQDNALIAVLPGSAEAMYDLSNGFAQRRENYAQSLGMTTLKPTQYPYLHIEMQTEQSVESTGYTGAMWYYAPVEDALWSQLQRLMKKETPVDGNALNWEEFRSSAEYFTYIGIKTGENDAYWIYSEGLMHYQNNGRDLVGLVEDKQAVELLRSAIAQSMGADPLEYVSGWMHSDANITSATLSFPDVMTGEVRTQTIVDEQSLKKLSGMVFEPQEVMRGGSACPFGGRLTLQTDAGELTLFVASDSCDVMSSQGVIYFDYQGSQEDLFALFPECAPGYGQEELPATVEILPTGADEWIILDEVAEARELYELVEASTTINAEQYGYDLGEKLYELDFRSAETKRIKLVELYENGIKVGTNEYQVGDGALYRWVEERAGN